MILDKQLIPELAALLERVAAHLAHQRQRSVVCMNGVSVCRYRGANGTACAIGCLFPDELHSPLIERSLADLFVAAQNPTDEGWLEPPRGHVAKALVDHLCSLAPSVHPEDLEAFLANVQDYHDYERTEDGACLGYGIDLQCTAPGTTDAELQATITAGLLTFLHGAGDEDCAAWWVKP